MAASSVMNMLTVEESLRENQSVDVTRAGEETGKNAKVCINLVLILY